MSDNVEDGFGPVLQRIQDRLGRMEDKIDGMSGRLVAVEKNVERVRLQITYALGQTTDANLRTVDVEDSVDGLRARLDALTHRVEELEQR